MKTNNRLIEALTLVSFVLASCEGGAPTIEVNVETPQDGGEVVAQSNGGGQAVSEPVVTPTPDPTPSASPTPDPTPSPSPTPDPTPSPSPTPDPTPSPSPTPPAPYTFSGGAGTIGDPYKLSTFEDVQKISEKPTSYFTVIQDINMSGQGFTPIASFSGTIYGNNYHLYNMAIATTGITKATMFTSMSGTIVSLVLQNVTLSAATYAAGFAGNLTGTLSGCSISGTITSPSGGNGFNTGTGRPTYVTKGGSAVITGVTQNVIFNGNTVNANAN